MDYEKIARDAGYKVVKSNYNDCVLWDWHRLGDMYREHWYESEAEAWKACCVDNKLI